MNVKKVNAKQLKKGMIVAAQGSFEPTNHFDVRCFKTFILILYSKSNDVCNTYIILSRGVVAFLKLVGPNYNGPLCYQKNGGAHLGFYL